MVMRHSLEFRSGMQNDGAEMAFDGPGAPNYSRNFGNQHDINR